VRVLHEARTLRGFLRKRTRKRGRGRVPFSLVLGAKRRGHRVRQYEKIRREATPIDDEIII
jgi:hypothetical protein